MIFKMGVLQWAFIISNDVFYHKNYIKSCVIFNHSLSPWDCINLFLNQQRSGCHCKGSQTTKHSSHQPDQPFSITPHAKIEGLVQTGRRMQRVAAQICLNILNITRRDSPLRFMEKEIVGHWEAPQRNPWRYGGNFSNSGLWEFDKLLQSKITPLPPYGGCQGAHCQDKGQSSSFRRILQLTVHVGA